MKRMRYTLGLDIGIESVGWAVLENNYEGEPIRIERLGVRIFDRAEHQDGAPLAEPRRTARGTRRVIRRRRHRKERIRKLIIDAKIMTDAEMESLFQNSGYEKSVYELRIEGLDRLFTKDELVRVLIHLAQRRGYHSNSKSEEAKDAKENGKVKNAISANRQRMEKHGYRTVGEMLWNDPDFQTRKTIDGKDKIIHNIRNAPDDYKVTVERSMVREEICMIFEAQKSFGAEWATDEFCEKYLEIWGGQRNFDEGPGGKNNPYRGNQIGKCSLEKREPRAAKASYTFEYFRLLQDVNHIRLVKDGFSPEVLTEEQRKIFIDLVMKVPDADYITLRKELALPDEYAFNHLYYGNQPKEEQEKKKLGEMKSYHKIRLALNKVEKNAIKQLTEEQLDTIGQILTIYKSDDNRREKLTAAGIPERFISVLLELSFSGTGKLSIKAMKKLIPYLEKGMTYDKAREAIYGKNRKLLNERPD